MMTRTQIKLTTSTSISGAFSVRESDAFRLSRGVPLGCRSVVAVVTSTRGGDCRPPRTRDTPDHSAGAPQSSYVDNSTANTRTCQEVLVVNAVAAVQRCI